MTYRHDDDAAVPELRMRVDDDDGGGNGHYIVRKSGYMRLSTDEEEEVLVEEEEGFHKSGSGFFCWSWRWCVFWYWFKLAVVFAFLGGLAFVVLKWVGPYCMDKEIIPIINWETTTFTKPVLALLVFVSLALFPTLLLPSSPSMWIAGMTFGYVYGFLLLTAALAIGISLPFCIGSLFLHKIQGWLEKYPKQASVLRSAGEGNWFHQFRSVALIRVSPFPYILYNYCAVATHVKYGPYLIGSLVGMIPDTFITIYTGILIETLADASQDEFDLSATQIIFNLIGVCLTVATTVFFTVYAKRRLKAIQDEPLLS